jgi:hypothetical protein
MTGGRASAIFTVKFANGDAVAVVHIADGRLGLGCAMNLARQAYADATGKAPPPIASAHYECDGEILENYTVEQLNSATA